MATATTLATRSVVKKQLDGRVISNDGNKPLVRYKDGEERYLERFLGRKELKVGNEIFQEAEPAATKQEFLDAFPIGSRVTEEYRPPKMYAMLCDRLNSTRKPMTVGDLIRELQVFPEDERIFTYSDEEGNQTKPLCEVFEQKFAKDDGSQFHRTMGLRVGEGYAVIRPHG